MGRRLRFVPAKNTLVEITCRVVQRRFLLRPSRELNDIALGVLGRAQRLCPIRVCAVSVLSNHLHLLAGSIARASTPRGARGESFDRGQFATQETLVLSPLPCWQDLPAEVYRARVADLVTGIEQKSAAERARTGARALGPRAIMAQHPHHRPEPVAESPAPLVHAATHAARRAFREGYTWFVDAFREAAEILRRGDRHAVFPAGSFPPGLPFVPG